MMFYIYGFELNVFYWIDCRKMYVHSVMYHPDPFIHNLALVLKLFSFL